MTSLDELLLRTEGIDFEVKKAQGRDGRGEVPQSFWATYSALANTQGGYVLLGAEQAENGRPIPLGLGDPERVRKALWDDFNNPRQVNINVLREEHIDIITQDDKQLLCIHVPRAKRLQRPVFVGANPFTGTYRRNYEGDYHCDEATVRRMLAEATEETRDAHLLNGFGMDDIDRESLAAYRHEFRPTKPGHPWLSLDDQELLRNLGGWVRDREEQQAGLTIAGLLMFGRLRSILDAIPHYVVDYQERSGELYSDVRWLDRITTDGTWCGNLYDFYRRVYPRLTAHLKVPFRLDAEMKRIDETFIHEALREAFVNALIHADYSGRIGILVVKRPGSFDFRNPGELRLPLPIVMDGASVTAVIAIFKRCSNCLALANRQALASRKFFGHSKPSIGEHHLCKKMLSKNILYGNCQR